MHLDRRALIQGMGHLAILGGLAPVQALSAPLGAYPFTLGVASGDPWPDGFVIWTRLAPQPLERHGGMPMLPVAVRWEVAEDEGFSRIVQQGEAIARPELAHSVHVELAGLQPQRPYWYRFMTSGSDTSPVGMVRTAPAADALPERLRIGVAGCQKWEHGYFDAWGHLASESDLDLVFHYGDYIYEGAPAPLGPYIPRQHIGDELYSLSDYRRRYAQYKTDPHLQAAHAACAFAMSFDDHEVDNNWAGDLDRDGTPPEVFALRRLAAMQAWYEHMPVRRAQMPGLHGITAHRRLDFGRLLRMHVLDTRSYRSDQPCNDGKTQPCLPEMHNSPTMLGARQEAWLDEGLAHGGAWNLLAQQVLMMPYDRRPSPDAAPDFPYDTWDGYRPARARMIETIQRHGLTNVVVASGDYHRHFAGTVPVREEAPDGAMAAVEFLATSISSNGDGRPIPDAAFQLANNPHIRLMTDRRGYQLFDITPQSWRTDVKVMDQVRTPGGSIETLASFIVTPDRVAIERA
ncbi:alkaline phosphatase D family protein [Novosphingobium mangrovi (ex Huang et al. 2023)]|uniref:Alkaline phosphatase D family protein n=1 Tax=Novosphingobium mangrovi (ex Huang et al. 2023) TaxID=2976432 RepID=A0ABT2I1L5_9SPHN|nr:alkaline phosphatase D family protein [Novosphingobium mangrovi (ex Huang et al. 2023)]MCT2398702.1 alkaline phosphatase D family protein [Novosphingobium mangrovi (ex Huang et al. 2023)]